MGRPLKESSIEARQQVAEVIAAYGGRVPLRQLKADYPMISRRELGEMKRQERRACRRGLCQLVWTRPGTVWSTDFTHVSETVDDKRKVLAVRDLASGRQLVAVPCESETDEAVRQALSGLFARQGPPLVLKEDNGSGFISRELRELLARHSVLSLYSPPRNPSYNGACEAGIGSLKARARCLATSRGHPGELTWDDLEDARCQSNRVIMRWCGTSISRDQVWQRRLPISPALRRHFLTCYRQHERSVRNQKGIDLITELSRREQASLDRIAIRATLVQLELLMIRRQDSSGG